MNASDILILYDYNYWANGRILAAAMRAGDDQFTAPTTQSFGSLRGMLVHILDVERAWRMLCRHQTIEYFDTMDQSAFPAVHALQQRWREEERDMREYLAQLGDNDMPAVVRYVLENGQTRERVLWHCLVHVVNHGTHHRSQAAGILKAFGHPAGELDLSVFLLERK